jgi:hypothetical protein
LEDQSAAAATLSLMPVNASVRPRRLMRRPIRTAPRPLARPIPRLLARPITRFLTRLLTRSSLSFAAGLLGLLLVAAAAVASPVVPGRPVSTADVTTNLVHAVPRSFLGFSMNVEEMEGFTDPPADSAFTSIINNVLNTNGNGPFVLRLGGTYIDSSYWDGDEGLVLPMYQANPAFSVNLDQAWMDSLANVVRLTGSKVILNVNAEAHSPQMASDFIADAEQTLPAGSLSAVAIGNEPDDYNNPIIPVARNAAWARGLTPATYASIFGNYARALHATVASIPLAGPESTGGESNWTSTLLQRDAGQVGLVTSHVYPLNACAPPGSPTYPSVFKYLQNSLVQGTTASLDSLTQLAANLNLPYRLTELGSGTCGGLNGVNNTFATSLWVVNQLFSFISAGLDGVNVHLRADTPNTAIEQDPNLTSGLQAEPLLYGLAAFTDALEPDDVLTQVTGQIQPNVSVWAVYGSEGWHLVLVNGSSSSQLIDLTVPATGAMSLTPLSAPSPWSSQVTFGGQTITPQGTWSGALDTTDVQPSNGVYPVVLGPASATIAAVGAAPGTSITAAIKRHTAAKRTPSPRSGKPGRRTPGTRKPGRRTPGTRKPGRPKLGPRKPRRRSAGPRKPRRRSAT